MHYFRAVSPKWVLPPMKETSCHIFKMAIFSKFFFDLITHVTREYACEKIKSFLNVSPLKIMDILLSVFMVSSLYYTTISIQWAIFKKSFDEENSQTFKFFKVKISIALSWPQINLFSQTKLKIWYTVQRMCVLLKMYG